jgi:autotransporter-associated beta strand protein
MKASRAIILCFAAVVVLAGGMMSQYAAAETFMWGGPYGSMGGQNWASSIKSQFGGTCWAFGACSTFESKYMLTRNDTSYQPDLSEQQLVWETSPDMGDTDGGWEQNALRYMNSHGVVLDSAVPHDPYHENVPGALNPWPLSSVFSDGVSNHYFIGIGSGTSTAGEVSYFAAGSTTAGLKAALRQYGPLCVALSSSRDLYGNVQSLHDSYSADTTGTSTDHAVELVGWVDDTSGYLPGGLQGYWIIKNSWSTGEGVVGYDVVPFGAIEQKRKSDEETGPVYYTGAMMSTTWTGNGSGGPIWTAATQPDYRNWANGLAWVNQETAATFDATATNRTISIANTVIAHQLTFNASGYTLNNGYNGALTVTNGGIQANQSVTINVPVYVGAPQTWTTAAGMTLNVTGALHTIISDLTIAGAGNTTIGGPIDGGGIINTYGTALPGNLIMSGTGVLTLSGASSYSGNITLGSGSLSLAPVSGAIATYTGTISGAGAMQKNDLGTVVLGGTNSSYTGAVTINQGQLTLNTIRALGSNTTAVTIAGGQLNYNVGGTSTSKPFNISGGGVLNQMTGGGTFSGAVTCTGAAEIRNSGGGSMALTNAAPISGDMGGGALTFNGGGGTINVSAGNINVTNNAGVTFSNGTTILNGAGNSWADGTTISNGTVQPTKANNLPSGTTVTLNNGTLNLGGYAQSIAGIASLVPGSDQVTTATACALTVAPTTDATYAGRLDGPISLTKNGSSTLILSGNNTLSASVTTTIGGGTLQIGGSATSGTLAGNVTITDGTFAIARSDDVSFGGNIGGAGSVTKNCANRLLLTGTNNYLGRTTITDGTLELALTAQSPILSGGGSDLQMGAIVFNYAGSSDPVTTIQDLLDASNDGGKWDIGQFQNSKAQLLGLTLGCVDDTTGQTVTVMVTYPGDFNLDGVVNAKDQAIWAKNAFSGSTWQQGDANGDGVVDGLDRDLLFVHTNLPALGGVRPASGFSPVPEPGTLALLAAALIGLLAYNLRKRK